MEGGVQQGSAVSENTKAQRVSSSSLVVVILLVMYGVVAIIIVSHDQKVGRL
jgi:hypothetical protein